ncbi:hypothetical protein [Leifsonia sp. RAF41]|uniref:hypothetical protein n=1 Tax=Leifsonia sp. RAF41 TaxID=3233056 RepID=UPI003F9BC9C3
MNDIATLILGVLTLGWTIWTALRASREKRSFERIEGLLKVKSTLEHLGTRGLDPSVGQERRDKSQKDQLETVTVALRRVSATYVGLVHKAVPSYLAAAIFLAYALWSGIMTYGLLNPKPAPGKSIDSATATANGIAAIVALALCVGFLILAILQWVRARRARVVLRDAGIDLRRPSEKAKAYAGAIGRLFSSGAPNAGVVAAVQVQERSDSLASEGIDGLRPCDAVPLTVDGAPLSASAPSGAGADEAGQTATAQLATPASA